MQPQNLLFMFSMVILCNALCVVSKCILMLLDKKSEDDLILVDRFKKLLANKYDITVTNADVTESTVPLTEQSCSGIPTDCSL